MVAHAPHTVMAPAKALVRGEDDEGVLGVPKLIELGEDLAHTIIHAADSRSVATDTDRIVHHLAVVVQPGMDRLSWEAGEILVRIVFRVPIPMCFDHVPAQAVRAVIADV